MGYSKKTQQLLELSNYAYKETKSLGVYDSSGNLPVSPTIEESKTSGINHPDTWQSTLADSRRTEASANVKELAAAFRGLHSTLKSEASNAVSNDDAQNSADSGQSSDSDS
jgi:hypothetical protein